MQIPVYTHLEHRSYSPQLAIRLWYQQLEKQQEWQHLYKKRSTRNQMDKWTLTNIEWLHKILQNIISQQNFIYCVIKKLEKKQNNYNQPLDWTTLVPTVHSNEWPVWSQGIPPLVLLISYIWQSSFVYNF